MSSDLVNLVTMPTWARYRSSVQTPFPDGPRNKPGRKNWHSRKKTDCRKPQVNMHRLLRIPRDQQNLQPHSPQVAVCYRDQSSHVFLIETSDAKSEVSKDTTQPISPTSPASPLRIRRACFRTRNHTHPSQTTLADEADDFVMCEGMAWGHKSINSCVRK